MVEYCLPSATNLLAEAQRRSSLTARLFESALFRGQWRRRWARLTGRSNALHSLECERVRGNGGRSLGRRLVEIDEIHGSEGRTSDFDDQFYPLSSHTQQRWQSVARAVSKGVGLPPVELIQVGQAYYVRDGHHRISVARALGQSEVEAEVTLWG